MAIRDKMGYTLVHGIGFGWKFRIKKWKKEYVLGTQQGSGRRNLPEATRRIFCEGKEEVGMQDEKFIVWFKKITKDVV